MKNLIKYNTLLLLLIPLNVAGKRKVTLVCIYIYTHTCLLWLSAFSYYNKWDILRYQLMKKKCLFWLTVLEILNHHWLSKLLWLWQHIMVREYSRTKLLISWPGSKEGKRKGLGPSIPPRASPNNPPSSYGS
jgi:hypothetical protein